jgi:hypothetical protein
LTASTASFTPFEKITLFLELQIINIVACQIKENPLLAFLLTAAPLRQSKSVKIFGGIIFTKSSHLKIALHTMAAKSQDKKR